MYSSVFTVVGALTLRRCCTFATKSPNDCHLYKLTAGVMM